MESDSPIINHLKIIIGTDVEADIVQYIHSIKSDEDLDEFMENLVDKKNSAHVNAFAAIRRILLGSKKKTQKNTPPAPQPSKSSSGKSGKTQQSQKGKKKFSDINAYQEKKEESEGRKPCDCEGQEHEFMNNCLNCGRIHCIKEGPGPCFYCQKPVAKMGEETYSSNQRGKNKNNTISTKQKENKVFDDDNDYFKIAGEAKTDNKRKMVIALDFATRRVIESTEEDVRIKEKLHKDIKKHLENVEKLYRKLQRQSEVHSVSDNNNDLVDLLIQMRHRKPAGVEDLGPEDSTTQVIEYGSKVYDEDVIQNTDHGLCLSMHQPYASLLVAGVKKHEGRTWKTNHRGKLWIAAAAKIPDEDEVVALEDFYRQYYNDKSIKFPRDYPTSCLLGCVFVEDCLDEATYRTQYPNGESSSPYVLICSNPIILPIFYPIMGQHKIYPLDKELHNCAKLSIRHAKYGVD